jgi:uncharacterized membrane protein YccC
MLLALGTAAIVLAVLLWELTRSRALRLLGAVGRRLQAALEHARSREATPLGYDPGRERRAEQRARELLRRGARLGDVP